MSNHDYENKPLSRFLIFDRKVLFSDLPPNEIDKMRGIDKLYRYDLRHGDDDSVPLTLEHRVVVNRFGTILSFIPLLADDEKSRPLTDDDWGFSGEDDMTPEAFYEMMIQKEA